MYKNSIRIQVCRYKISIGFIAQSQSKSFSVTLRSTCVCNLKLKALKYLLVFYLEQFSRKFGIHNPYLVLKLAFYWTYVTT